MLIKPVKIDLTMDAVIYNTRMSDWYNDTSGEDISRFFTAKFRNSNSYTVIDPMCMAEFEVRGIKINVEAMLRPKYRSEMPNFKILGMAQPVIITRKTDKTDQNEFDIECQMSFFVDDSDMVYLRLISDYG